MPAAGPVPLVSSHADTDTARLLGHPFYDRDSEAAGWHDHASTRPADEDRCGGRNTITRFADADLATPEPDDGPDDDHSTGGATHGDDTR